MGLAQIEIVRHRTARKAAMHKSLAENRIFEF
jgi:hypothetical protein